MQTTLNFQEIADRGEEIYATRIRDKVEATEEGKSLVLDINSGDYEIDTDDMAAQERLSARRPDGVMHGILIGSPAAHLIGAESGI